MEYRLRKVFNQVVKFKPELLRSESKEFYFIAMDKKNKILTKPEIFGLKQ